MYRNPKDVAASYFHFANVLTYVQYFGPFERFAKLFIRDKGKFKFHQMVYNGHAITDCSPSYRL